VIAAESDHRVRNDEREEAAFRPIVWCQSGFEMPAIPVRIASGYSGTIPSI